VSSISFYHQPLSSHIAVAICLIKSWSLASKPRQRADDIEDIANIWMFIVFISDDTGIATPTKGSKYSYY
jgi:hypothetical protein